MLASRRHVLNGAASLALTAAAGPAFAAIGPDDKFDLLIKGGEVLDRITFDRGSFSTLQSSGFMLLGMTLSARNRLAGGMIETISWVRSGW